MMRYCLLFLFVVVATFFVDSHQQQCIKLTTSLCDDVNDDVTATNHVKHSIPGKAGPKGERGEKGDRGESCDQNDVIIDVITKMNETLYELQGTLVEMQGRITKLELAEEDRTAAYELRLTPRKGNFDEAREMCQQMGGDLMQKTLLTNTSGGSYLEKLRSLSTDAYLFIGMTDRDVEGSWKYLNGEDFIEENSISNWDADCNEPNGGRGENCGTAIQYIDPENPYPYFRLNDYPCNGHSTGQILYGVCEIKI